MVLSRTYNNENFCTWFPYRLGSEDHTRPWFCPELIIIKKFCTWFPHRLGSEDHTRPWFCPELYPLFYAPVLPSGIPPVSEREVALGNSYSLAWAVVRGPPCRTGPRRELTKPTDLEAFPWSLVTRYLLASQCSRCAFTRLL